MKIGIFVVSFNNSVFTEKQIISLKTYIKNDFDLFYLDNSTIQTDIEKLINQDMGEYTELIKMYKESGIKDERTFLIEYNKQLKLLDNSHNYNLLCFYTESKIDDVELYIKLYSKLQEMLKQNMDKINSNTFNDYKLYYWKNILRFNKINHFLPHK